MGWSQKGESTYHNKYEIEEMKQYMPKKCGKLQLRISLI